MDPLGFLYPEGVLDTQVITRVPAPRLPSAPPREWNGTTPHRFYKDRLIRETACRGLADRLAIVDKAFPHSRYDAMVLASNDDVRSDMASLERSTAWTIMRLAHSFVSYAHAPATVARFGLAGGQTHVCYNYDVDTTDRENAMYQEKRFHLHLNCWPGRDLAGLHAMRFGDLPATPERWRIVDPVSFIAQRVAFDALGGSMGGYPILPPDARRDADQRLPIGLKVVLPGWHVFLRKHFALLLQGLHITLRHGYEAVYLAFVGKPYERPVEWSRPRLLEATEIERNVKAMSWLTPEAKDGLVRLGSVLRDVQPREIEWYKSHPGSAVRLALGGLDYSVGFSGAPIPDGGSPSADSDDRVIMALQLKLFGNVGGASLPPLAGSSAAKLDRMSGSEMMSEEIADRLEFRNLWMKRSLDEVETFL